MASASEELFWSDEEETKKSPLEEKFDKAAAAVRNLSGTLSQQNLLYLYGRYKIAKDGKCSTSRPGGLFNLEAKRKWDSWAELGHLSKEAAMQEYVAKVIELMPSLTSTAQKPVAAKSAFGLSVSRPAMQEETAEEDSQLLKLIKSGDSDGLTKYLAVKSVDLDILDSEGLAPIHWAADRGFSDVLEVLLKFKANVDLTDAQDQQTALHYAVSCGHNECVKVLLQHKANVNVLDVNGEKPMDLANNAEITELLSSG